MKRERGSGISRRRTIGSFERRGQQHLGSGTYGAVFMARDRENNNKVVAVKRFHTTELNLQHVVDNEMRVHAGLDHPNIVRLFEIVTGTDDREKEMFMILECMKHDLRGIIQNASKLYVSIRQLKCYMQQASQGVAYLHSVGVIHRDLKPANILISETGVAKLADFGLACKVEKEEESKKKSYDVITMWYRPPELLLMATDYLYEVDVWSMGCIIAELLLLSPLFPATDPHNQLNLIWDCCGTPVENDWPDAQNLMGWKHFGPHVGKVVKRDLKAAFKEKAIYFTPGAINLMEGCLTLDPKKRMKASDIMHHPYLTEESPVALSPQHMPKYPASYFGKLTFDTRGGAQQQKIKR